MSGFDLPPVGHHDLSPFPRGGLRELLGPPSIQDPERTGLPASRAPAIDDASSGSFAGALTKALDQVQSLQDDVQGKVRGLALGEDVEVHDVLLATAKSEVAFNLLLEVRNKLVDAWEKLSRATV